jgi:NCS1 family nucleobase:cation symporter-1
VSKNRFRVHGVSNSLWNEDLAPIARDDRAAGPARLFAAWSAIAVCVPAWLLASGLVVAGMTGIEALGTILLGCVIVLVVASLCGDAGTKYGIPAAALMRTSFGVVGAHVPAILRALVSCVWFGIHCWIGGLALFAMLKLAMPEIGTAGRWVCFAIFWLVSVALALKGIEKSAIVQKISVALLLIAALELLFRVLSTAGASPADWVHLVWVRPVGEVQPASFGRLCGPSLNAVVGFWSLIALAASDLTRTLKSHDEKGIGTLSGMLVAMLFCAVISVIVSVATMVSMPIHARGWNPIDLLAGLPQLMALVGLIAVALGTLGMNLTTCVEAPAAAFSSLIPRQISYRTGVLITGLVGVLAMPWQLLADPSRYVHGWLLGCSGVLGPIIGVMLADYIVLRRRSLDVEGLYVRAGEYEYSSGFNIKAIRALTAGMIVAEAGLFLSRLNLLYDYGWFVGFGVAALIYLALMRLPTERAVIPPTPLMIPMQGFEGEGA